jgi:hypothetical protein
MLYSGRRKCKRGNGDGLFWRDTVFDVDMDNDLDIVYPAAPFRIEPTPRVMQGSDLIE